MKVEMLMPQMGESIAEATILKWLKAVGDPVKKDEIILEISTDKVDSEIPAPAAGVIVELKAEPGQTVPVKSIVAIIETDAAAATVAPSQPAPSQPAAIEAAKPALKAPPVEATAPQATTGAASQRAQKTTLRSPYADDHAEHGAGLAEFRGQIPAQVADRFYSPLVRNLAAQQGLTASDLAQIPGTGAHGRLTKQDIVQFLEQRGNAPASPAPSAPVREQPKAKEQPAADFNADGLHIEPMDSMRRKIAEHMVRSKSTSPHAYTVAEVDVSRLARYREKNQKAFLAREGFKLSFTPFFMEASAKALSAYPQVNGYVDGDKHVWRKNVNLGCAVALGTTGLIVPVIKGADQLTLVGLARALNDLALRARSKKLQPDEVQGGSFTITNPGIFGSIIGYPIINQPQLAILGVGAIKKRPVVVDDMIAIREIVYLTLSYDHRVIDGAMGGSFLQSIVKHLEEWDLERPL